MKMSKAMYEDLKTGIRTVVDYYGVATVYHKHRGHTLTRMMWDLFSVVTFDWMYDDSHPAYGSRVRLVPFKGYPTFSVYEEVHGLNDAHIETVLKKIAAELGLTPLVGQDDNITVEAPAHAKA